MAKSGTHDDTINWLNGQIVEIDRWKADMAGVMPEGSKLLAKRLSEHREWLATAVADLGHANGDIN
ncbi:MAG: hypothetical protein AAGF33_03125 [Pseudomonadota bacterium]